MESQNHFFGKNFSRNRGKNKGRGGTKNTRNNSSSMGKYTQRKNSQPKKPSPEMVANLVKRLDPEQIKILDGILKENRNPPQQSLPENKHCRNPHCKEDGSGTKHKTKDCTSEWPCPFCGAWGLIDGKVHAWESCMNSRTQCQCCAKQGHIARNCPLLPTCQLCLKKGHTYDRCIVGERIPVPLYVKRRGRMTKDKRKETGNDTIKSGQINNPPLMDVDFKNN